MILQVSALIPIVVLFEYSPLAARSQALRIRCFVATSSNCKQSRTEVFRFYRASKEVPTPEACSAVRNNILLTTSLAELQCFDENSLTIADVISRSPYRGKSLVFRKFVSFRCSFSRSK